MFVISIGRHHVEMAEWCVLETGLEDSRWTYVITESGTVGEGRANFVYPHLHSQKKKKKSMQFTVSAEFLLQQKSKESKKLTMTGADEHEVSRNGKLIRLRLVLSWTPAFCVFSSEISQPFCAFLLLPVKNWAVSERC